MTPQSLSRETTESLTAELTRIGGVVEPSERRPPELGAWLKIALCLILAALLGVAWGTFTVAARLKTLGEETTKDVPQSLALLLPSVGEAPHQARYTVVELPGFLPKQTCPPYPDYSISGASEVEAAAKQTVMDFVEHLKSTQRVVAIVLGTHDIHQPSGPLSNPTLAQMRAHCARTNFLEPLLPKDTVWFEIPGGATDPAAQKGSPELQSDRVARVLLIAADADSRQ